MSPIMLRQFWSLVEMTRASIPLTMDDPSLAQWLLRRVRSERSLNNVEADILTDYIRSRLPLIRDLAQDQAC
ncbi:hypothetical protein [Thermocoleostomius sinensis]|jgi:hypothetical protein|uniref:Uncharacterized protein n=1 Tax=Thermocoleostomius sinensis A174 TaxID=2016057 RepID=A0A9E9C9E4_9CYAN|nr:hypothetical protein [Thermocoleostomius sinensis]WAL62584.1 hypothetical protein OXH18_11500 [Thermocoleostomius sinensis A174]